MGQPRDVLALLRRARIGSESHGVEVAFLVPSLPSGHVLSVCP